MIELSSYFGRAIAVAAPAGLVIWIFANVGINGQSLLSIIANFLDPFASLMSLDGYILAAFIFGIIMFCICFPLSLIGLLLSKNTGEPNTFSKIGKILGIIGIIISGLILLFGFIGLINYNSYVPSYSPNYDLDLNDYYF